MNKIESNAIRIAELTKTFMYNPFARMGQLMSERRGERIRCIEYYSSYNELMQIIESEISEYELKIVHFELKTDSLLEAVQYFVIRYLELKNGNSLGS